MTSQERRHSRFIFSVCENIVFRFLIAGLHFRVRRISLGRKAFQFVHGRRVNCALEVSNNLRCRVFLDFVQSRHASCPGSVFCCLGCWGRCMLHVCEVYKLHIFLQQTGRGVTNLG